MGKILNIDLSSRKCSEEIIDHTIYEDYLSGNGLSSRLLYDRIPAGADPLGPENVLAFVSGLLTGTGAFFAGRWMISAKSPLTGGWGESNCGGILSPVIKRCGYDGIFFSGESPDPVYVLIVNGRTEIRDASHIWGLDTHETEVALRREVGEGKVIASIGPAGERLSLISGVCHDGGRMAARSGLGAVMGAKKLKALVMEGHGRIPVYNREEVKRLSRVCARWINFQPPFLPAVLAGWLGTVIRILPFQVAIDGMLYKILLRKWGTGSMNQISVEMGDAPVKNWRGSNEDWGLRRSHSVNPDIIKKMELMKYHCYSCPLGCGGIIDRGGVKTHKPEYETIIALGALCLNDDLETILYLNELLNRAGMDTISAGSTVAFAMECYENGILSASDLDGLELTWGNAKAMVSFVEKMIKREGIGDIFADGVKRAAERIGKDAQKFAIHAGGQELPMHDGRNDPNFNIHYSVEPTPGRHTIGSQMYYEMFRLWKKISDLPRPPLLYSKNHKYILDYKKTKMAASCSQFMNVANGAGLCLFGLFLGVDRIPVFQWINAATGWQFTPQDYLAIGKRIQELKQMFNVRHGITPPAVRVPDRAAGIPPLEKGANRGRSIDMDKWMKAYWREFSWDEQTGVPKGAGGNLNGD